MCPKGMQKIIRSRKFTPRVSPKKLKTLFVTGQNDVLKTISWVFLWEHEIPLVTNLLICNTRQTLVEWDFSTTNKTTKVDMQTKVGPIWTGAPSDKFSWELHSGNATCHGVFQISILLCGCQVQVDTSIFQLVMTRDSFPVEKPSSQDKRTRWKKTSSWLQFSLWKMTQKTDNVSQWPSLEGKGINRKWEYL